MKGTICEMKKMRNLSELMACNCDLVHHLKACLSRRGISDLNQQLTVNDFFRCMICKAKAADSLNLSLPPMLDQTWHDAILETKLYKQLQDSLESTVDHTATTQFQSIEQKNQRVDAMVTSFFDNFGIHPSGGHWTREVDHLSVKQKEEDREPAVKKERKNDTEVDDAVASFNITVYMQDNTYYHFRVTNDLTVGMILYHLEQQTGYISMRLLHYNGKRMDGRIADYHDLCEGDQLDAIIDQTGC